MKDCDKNKESSYLKYWDANNLYGWTMYQKFLVNNLKWVRDISKFDKSFIKSSNEESDKGYFLEVDVQYTENFCSIHYDLPSFPEKMKMLKRDKLYT